MITKKQEAEQLKEIMGQDTDEIPCIKKKGKAVSADMCARINALIDPRWSSIVIFFKTKDTYGYARLINMVPASEPGYLVVRCDTIRGNMILEIGAGIPFDLRMQIL